MAASVQKQHRNIFPGFGLRVDYLPDRDYAVEEIVRFQNVICDWTGGWLTVKEIAMATVMNELMEKPNWEIKVFDEEIVGRWKDEALAETGPGLSEKMWQWELYGNTQLKPEQTLAELRDKAIAFVETGIVPAIDLDCEVLYSDKALSSEDAAALSAAVKPLEDVPEPFKDWHPGSNQQVLDLVHPSLFPLLYGRSRVLQYGTVALEDCVSKTGKGKLLPVPTNRELICDWYFNDQLGEIKGPWSGRFQWLPCEVAFNDDDSVRITSYINNLRPGRHDALYHAIEKVIAKSVPLWTRVLESTENQREPRLDVNEWEYSYTQGPIPPELDFGDDDDLSLAEDVAWVRVLNHPEPRLPYLPRQPADKWEAVDLRKDFSVRGLQVIVKLANIHLTPSQPSYAGGTWHVEGQLNERIVATSLYYYDQSNISPSFLSFRQPLNTNDAATEIRYDQHDYDGLEEILGVKSDEPAFQVLGSVATKTGRLLAFPNVLQHRVTPFELLDKTQPGHRKILALFLVDPHVPIISTAIVPPQQREWWAEDAVATGTNRLSNLPEELKAHIVRNVDEFPISMEEAKRLRLELMAERSQFRKTLEELEEFNSFNFCEH